MITVTREVEAPDNLGVAMARVPLGSPVTIECRLESVLEGVWLSGIAEVQVEAECSRCLDPVSWEETIDLQQMFEYPATDARGAVIDDPEAEEDPLPLLEDDCIDLEPVLRDSVVLSLPLSPLCRSDCPGLCIECGARLEDDPQHSHEQLDPRWSALANLLDEGSDENASTTD